MKLAFGKLKYPFSFKTGNKTVIGRMHGHRHRVAQLKAINKGRFTGKNSRFGL